MKDDGANFVESLRRLGAHWRLLAAFAVLIAFAAIYAEHKLFPAAPPSATVAQKAPARMAPSPTAPVEKPAGEAPKAPVDKSEAPKAPADKSEAPPNAGVETPADSVLSQTVEVAARPVVLLKGQGKWDDAFKTLSEAVDKVSGAVAKAGLKANGRPLAVFTETDDTGFHFQAMVPLSKAPEGKPELGEGLEIGSSPTGKALKFQHRGAYDEIDATYEAIAAYLDEKGLDTKDLIVEEYLTGFKTGDDATVEVDIYVFVK
jgi:effector-binding domain-containing protein